jgi:hypothetical protein
VNGPAKYGTTLAEQWQSYEAGVIPRTASPVQRVESRRAFYAGAQALFEILTRGASDGDEVTDDDEQLMLRVNAEIQAFIADVKAGRA